MTFICRLYSNFDVHDLTIFFSLHTQMADRDDEQILLDTIAEGSSQYLVDDERNEDPNQYLNEEGNEEGNQDGNQDGTEEGTDSQTSAGQKRPRGKRGPTKKLE